MPVAAARPSARTPARLGAGAARQLPPHFAVPGLPTSARLLLFTNIATRIYLPRA